MIEVEVKARCGQDVMPKILALGAIKKGVENHCDVYFNSSHADFRETDEALRIRIKEGGARLTYKGPKLDVRTKSRLELTVEINDPQAMQKILVELGFWPSTKVKKRRTKYALGDITFALDEVESLGSFIEIETPAEGDWEKKSMEVMNILHQLGLGESIRKSYVELLEEQLSGGSIRS
jgi:adenylate cyclase, class 2